MCTRQLKIWGSTSITKSGVRATIQPPLGVRSYSGRVRFGISYSSQFVHSNDLLTGLRGPGRGVLDLSTPMLGGLGTGGEQRHVGRVIGSARVDGATADSKT